MTQLQGILPAVVTPFDDSLRFAPEAFERLLDALYAAGVHGIDVCGQTGEGRLQSVAQRKLVSEAAVRASPPGRIVMIHTGAEDVDDAVELVRHAERIGAHAVSSLPPQSAHTPEAIHAYYRALASATGLPLLLYYFPEICPAIADPAQLDDILALTNVVGLKFTDFNLFRLWKLRRGGAAVFNGRDEVLAAGLLMQASGGIGSFYNLVPELFLRVWDLSRLGRWDEAYCAQATINELIDIVIQFPVFPAIKKILSWSGLECGQCDPAYRALTVKEEIRLRGMLSRSGLAGQSFAGLRID